MKPDRVTTMPNAIYWAADKMESAVAIVAGAYLIVHGYVATGIVLIVIAVL